MFLDKNLSSRGSFLKPELFSCLLPVLAAVIFIFTASAFDSDEIRVERSDIAFLETRVGHADEFRIKRKQFFDDIKLPGG